ncbi:YqeG family HAD IIIA-type phosphatase [Cyanobium sp. Morenito 9A2]|uniref:YqeG family HAD IIIA-type phosphatase n=1 Tax=Cyanobium sp. Morenito 9A2 TaxID=2823718 RepID=UPI0020CF5D4B|nr:YqeG family HAD IIIA-type phosphatase [Cyanobium sp. Morenito 9A2]MCP9848657.1 YqeG family HAD IIIA-type phosphatase [Cyanobium sp. Morenito 9A2]
MSLPQLLQPDWLASGTVAELSLDRLLAVPLGALVLDVDRTLLPARHAELPASIEAWLQRAQQHLKLRLFSNNPSKARIGSVADRLGVPFTTSAGKPRRSALRRVLAELNLPPQQVALVGDRLFTDVLAGNRLGLYTVLVKPVNPSGLACERDRLQNLEMRLARWVGSDLG